MPADGARDVPDVSVAGLDSHAVPASCRGTPTGTIGLCHDFGGTSVLVAGLRRTRGPPVAAGRHAPRQPEPAPLRGSGARSTAAAGSAPARSRRCARSTTSRRAATRSRASRATTPAPGYDAATGLGSLDAAALASALPAPAPATTDFTLAADPARRSLPASPAASSVESSRSRQLTLAPTGAADAVATVTVAGLPAGVTAEFRPASPRTSRRASSRAPSTRRSPYRAMGATAAGHVSPRPHGGVGIGRPAHRALPHGGRRAAAPPHGSGVQAPVVLDVLGAGLVALHVRPRGREPQRRSTRRSSSLRSRGRHPGAGDPPSRARCPPGRQLYVPDVIAFLAANG